MVRNVWRLYGGWWDGNPASLKPAPEAALAGELAALAGRRRGPGRPRPGPGRSRRPRAPTRPCSLRLAGHLAELAALAAPTDPGVHRVRAEVFTRLSETATSTMAKGVFSWTARESDGAVRGPRSEATALQLLLADHGWLVSSP